VVRLADEESALYEALGGDAFGIAAQLKELISGDAR
jgi:hypothetical protein